MNKPDPEKWVNKYSDILLKFAYIRVNNEEIAKDLVQDTYFSALKNLDGFRGEASEKNWLFLILKNKITDYYRKKAITSDVEIETGNENFFKEAFDETGHWWNNTKPEEWNTEYDSVIDSREFMKTFELCKGKLPEIHNIVFCLRFIDGEKSDEVCMKLGITSSNYWIMLHRAKLQLRKCLEKNWFNL
ncbi:MAG: sigma-70 family RNA polymerase sigma factor [bacterium]|nr:sigma-70 family RNA polymerase sigma factor [bacterium]